MGSISSRQGSAAFSSARRTSRLIQAAFAAIVVVFCATTPAMAATVNVGSSNELFYDAAGGEVNVVTVTGDGNSLTLRDTGATAVDPGTGCTTVDPQAVTCTGVGAIKIEAGNLDDTVTLTTALLSYVYGQDGADTLNGGDGLDMLRGGDGNDVLNGGAGNDTLFGEAGDDQLTGGPGSDTADFVTTTGVTVDLTVSGPQDTGEGVDSLTEVENIDGTSDRDVLTGDAAPNRFIGSGGNDSFDLSGEGSDSVNCGGGFDQVLLNRSDAIRGLTSRVNPCEYVDDNEVPGTAITAGIPDGPTNQAQPLSWEFESDEPWADFQCTLVDTPEEVFSPVTAWDPCRSGHSIPVQAEDASKVFAVRAVDDQTNEDPTPESRAFTIDTISPDTSIDAGPPAGGVTNTATPQFSFSSPDPSATYLCRFDFGNFFACPNPFTADPLSDGEHTLQVAASDAAGNFDQTPASLTFRVVTGGTGAGGGSGSNPPAAPAAPVQQAKIIIGSLVLISGNAVKMSRKGRVSISLTCAGAQTCSGRLSITTAEPVRKRGRKLVTLGAKRFTIAANKKRKVNVRFSKRNIRLAQRLKRFKAKAVIREVDSRGNPRISSRIFTLRAP